MSGRPVSSMRGRPPTGSMGRPPSGMRMGPPTTGRPGTRSGNAAGGSSVFASGIKVADRPMTQQGLSGQKTSRGTQRQIQDRTFWLGEVRSKCNEMSTEIRKVENDIKKFQEENNTFLMFEKRAETLASEISDLQGELHDYNMMIDRVNMNQELPDMVEDLDALKIKNDKEAESLERIFEQKESKEKQIEVLDREMSRQKTLTENRVQDMDPDMRQHYSNLKRDGLQTMDELVKLQDELDALASKQSNLEAEMQHDMMKQEAVRLYEKLNDLKQKQNQLEEEDQSNLSPEQEQQQLLATVKSLNQEISSMDRQSKELDDKVRAMQEELQQVEDELEDQESEAAQKFRQIQKREQVIDDFERNYDRTKEEEIEQQQALDENIVALLEEISKTLSTAANLPSTSEMQALKDDLQFKEGELHKAEATSNSLVAQTSNLQFQLNKVEELENKITSEKSELIQKMDKMQSEIETYKNLDELRADSERRKRELERELEELNGRKHDCRKRAEQMYRQYQELLKELEENDTHTQLNNLLKKWQHVEQNNFSLKEYVASRSVDCDAVKGKVLKGVAEMNKILQEICAKSSLYNSPYSSMQ